MKHERMNSLLTRLAIIVLAIGLIVGIASSAMAAKGPSAITTSAITTDRTKYSLGDTIVISGIGFTPNGTVNIEVQLPGKNGIDTLPPVLTDSAGSFQTSYTPPMIPGRYKITATDGTNTAKTAATVADAGRYSLYGFEVGQTGGPNPKIKTGWAKGNLAKFWAEGEWVPYQFVVEDVQTAFPLLGNITDISVDYDFTLQGARFVDLVKNIQIGTQMLTDDQGWPDGSGNAFPMTTEAELWAAQNYPGEHAWNFGNFELAKDQPGWDYLTQVNTDMSGGNGTTTDADHKFVVTADQIKAALAGHETTDTIVLYFQLHLARTFVWSNALESGYNTAPTDAWGGWLYGDPMYATDSRPGSGEPQGSPTHVTANMAVGEKTVPIPVPPMPTGLIDGYKFNDEDNSGTNMTAGEDGIPGWRVYIIGNVSEGLTFSASNLTLANGFYEFTDLTDGIWYVAEDIKRESPDEDFWSQTYPNSGTAPFGVATPILSSGIPFIFPGSPALGPLAYSVALNISTSQIQHHVNFGNVGTGCLNVTKAINMTGLTDGSLVDLGYAEFSINVTGPSYPGGHILTFNLTGGVLSGPDGGNSTCLCDLMPGNYTATEAGLAGWEAANITGSPAEVKGGDACDDAVVITVTNTPIPGCLNITKAINMTGVEDGGLVDLGPAEFSVNVTGPSYPDGKIIGFNLTGGVLYVDDGDGYEVGNSSCLCSLIPGNYTAVETVPDDWEEAVLDPASGEVTVEAGDECDDSEILITVTNAPTPGCLNITKVVDLDEYPFASSANSTFAINLTGPSYPAGDELTVTFNLTNGVLYVHNGTAWVEGDSYCICSLIPGNYTVAETPPAGWNLTGITPPQPVTVEAGTECGVDAVEVAVNNTLLIPHTTMLEITYIYDSVSGNVTMNITDCNDGEVPLTDAGVYLRANNVTYGFSPMNYTSPYFAGGDTNLNPGDSAGVLDPGECWTWVVNVTIDGTTFFEAWGDGIDPLGNHVTYNPDTGEGYESEYQSFEIARCWGDETAWAHGGGYAEPNWDHADSNNWGWTNNISEGSYVWDLYAGAGQNILSKGEVVGTVSVNYTGGCVNVTYNVIPGYYLGETHLWVGNDPLPEVSRGGQDPAYTDAPGQFPYGVDYGFDPADSDTWETEWTWFNCSFEGDIYVAAHGVVWMQVECPEQENDGLVQTVETDSSDSSDSGGSFWEWLFDWFRSLFRF